MKTILCYGDSNTYGYNPANGLRYGKDVRWTGRLAQLLGEEYQIIEEGCNGRTTIFEDPAEGWKRGLDYLKPCLNTHKPVDLVILMLGTNDLKEMFQVTAEQIAGGAAQLVDVIQSFTKEKQGYEAQVLLVSPAQIGDRVTQLAFRDSFGMRAVEESRKLAPYYETIAQKKNCLFLNAAEYIKPSETDCVHFDPDAHAMLAQVFADCIRQV